MKTFKIDKELTIVCEWKKTRNGFKHEATLLKNGSEIDRTKINYLNRTWESFEFKSVVEKLLDKTEALTERKKDNFLTRASDKAHEETRKEFGFIGAIAKMGEVFGKTKKEKNDWKARMLKAGLENKGLIMPDDWGSLTENEKEKRLNGVISELNK